MAQKIKALIKRALFLLPPVRVHYRHIEQLRINLEDNISEINKTRAYAKLLENQLETIVEDKKECPLCNNTFWKYLPGGEIVRQNALCPYCESLERFRAWHMYYGEEGLYQTAPSRTLLHFAPEKGIYDSFTRLSNLDYYPVDYNPDFQGIRDTIDIQNIKYADNMFDVIICNNVLEHIPNDRAAIKELRRVLKKDGVAYITVPFLFSCDTTLENPEYNTPELRVRYYGSYDHLRQYGSDFASVLRDEGFVVCEVKPNGRYTPEELKKYGILEDEIVFKCTVGGNLP